LVRAYIERVKLTDLPTVRIITSNIKASVSSLGVARQRLPRLPTMDIPLLPYIVLLILIHSMVRVVRAGYSLFYRYYYFPISVTLLIIPGKAGILIV
jgi:hypothetical protein